MKRGFLVVIGADKKTTLSSEEGPARKRIKLQGPKLPIILPNDRSIEACSKAPYFDRLDEKESMDRRFPWRTPSTIIPVERTLEDKSIVDMIEFCRKEYKLDFVPTAWNGVDFNSLTDEEHLMIQANDKLDRWAAIVLKFRQLYPSSEKCITNTELLHSCRKARFDSAFNILQQKTLNQFDNHWTRIIHATMNATQLHFLKEGRYEGPSHIENEESSKNLYDSFEEVVSLLSNNALNEQITFCQRFFDFFPN